jgi:hypothetical protein
LERHIPEFKGIGQSEQASDYLAGKQIDHLQRCVPETSPILVSGGGEAILMVSPGIEAA